MATTQDINFLLKFLSCPNCKHTLTNNKSELLCNNCNKKFFITKGIPQMFSELNKAERKTRKLFSVIWDYFLEKIIEKEKQRGGFRGEASKNIYLIKKLSSHHIKSNSIGLDIGCGIGYDMELLVKEIPNICIIGIDISSGVKHVIKRKKTSKNIYAVEGKITSLPFKNVKFDFVYSIGVIHHAFSPDIALKELLRVLKISGTFIIFIAKDFSDMPFLIQQIYKFKDTVRIFTSKLPIELLLIICVILSLPIYVVRTIMKTMKKKQIPLGHMINIRNIISSLLDRLSVPYEFKYNKNTLIQWFSKYQLKEFKIVDCTPYGFKGFIVSGIK